MGRQKGLRMKEVLQFRNVFTKEKANISSLWYEKFFNNNHPLILELGCGKGEYTNALARLFPQNNFIGVDRKADRIWIGAKIAQGSFPASNSKPNKQKQLTNVAYLRTKIESLGDFFEPASVSEIWITFPDPYLRKPTKRMTNTLFLEIYRLLLAPKGILHLKTDEKRLYDFSLATFRKMNLEIIFKTDDLYASSRKNGPATKIQTFYEKKHISDGNEIFYIKARFKRLHKAKKCSIINRLAKFFNL